MKAFKVSLFNLNTQTERTIIAPCSVDALRIGIRMMPEFAGHGPVGITCTPHNINPKEEAPCAPLFSS